MKSRKRTGIIIISLIMIFVVVSNHVFSLELNKKAAYVFSPVGIIFSNFGQGVSDFFYSIGNIGSLQKENEDLQAKLNTALIEIAVLSEAEKENDSLRADLGFKESSGLDLVAAEVAYFDPSLTGGITVKVESNDGIEIGNVVLSEGFLVGCVSNISGNFVTIQLITDSNSSIPTTIQNKNISGIATGEIGNGLNLEQVPQNDNVVVGDSVITSGLGGSVPKGLILGTVTNVSKSSNSIFQDITLSPMIGFSEIERVLIAR